jgi:2-amino-4-hydroxy-6-hydroxymethyldihydropteridine diphosphokinase
MGGGTVYVGLGANLGDARATLHEALGRLDAHPAVAVVARSSDYGSDPVGGPEQPAYTNAVARLRTTLEPQPLLEVLLETEAALGRVRGVRFGPRTCDLDLLLYDDRVISEPGLEVPHPRMAERRFVLEPLAELEPALALPDGRRIADLLELTDGQRVWRLGSASF